MSREIPPDERITWGEYLRVMQSGVGDEDDKAWLKNAPVVVKGWENRAKGKGRVRGKPAFKIVFTVSSEYPPYTRAELEEMQREIEEEMRGEDGVLRLRGTEFEIETSPADALNIQDSEGE